MPAQSWTHGLVNPERLDPVVTDEFEKLIASLESYLAGFQKDDDGAILLGGLAPAGNVRTVWFGYNSGTTRWIQLNGTIVRGPTATDATDVDAVNTTAETSVYSTTVLANTLTSRVLLLTLVADILNDSLFTRILQVRVKWAGSTVLSGAHSLGISLGSRRAYGLLIAIVGTTASTQRIWGREYVQTGDGVQGTFQPASDRGATNSATADLRADQTLQVTVEWDTAHALLSFRKTGAVVKIR